MQGWFNISKSMNEIHHVNRLKKKKKSMIISIDTEKAFDKSPTPISDKNYQLIRNRGVLPQVAKNCLQKSYCQHHI